MDINIALLPGDGIGPEIIAEATKVLDRTAAKFGHRFSYTPALLGLGLKIMIGKGKRSPAVVEAMKRNKAVYLIAVGGAAALIKSRVTACEDVAYPDLGCEAVRRLTVKDLPLLVAIDSRGESIL